MSTAGTPDTSFGFLGTIDPPGGYGGKTALGVGVQADGKVVIAVTTVSATSLVIRYNLDGSVDPSFGSNGVVTLDSSASSMLMKPDGSILLSGLGFVSAFTADGILDVNFGTDGTTAVPVGSFAVADMINVAYKGDYVLAPFAITHMALQPDGSTVGLMINGDWVRWTADGNLNPLSQIAYPANQGGVPSSDSNDKFLRGGVLTTQSDGKILVADSVMTAHDFVFRGIGVLPWPSDSDFRLTRYNADGTLDTTFGSGGTVATDVGNLHSVDAPATMPMSIAVQGDGKILVAGNTTVNHVSQFVVVRYDTEGSLDSTFGSGGIATVDFPHNAGFPDWSIDLCFQVTVQPDGKILLIGTPGLARLTPEGKLDSSFSDDGMSTGNGTFYPGGDQVAIAPDGSLIVLHGTGSITKVLGAGTGQVVAGAGSNDHLVGTSDNDTITGDAGSDTLFPGAGNDSVLGGDGDDVSHGGSNNDTVNGGPGNDYIRGGHGDDVLIGEDGQDSVFGAVGSDLVQGGESADHLRGNQGSDSLYGGAGADDLAGGIDNDQVFGGADNDVVVGGTGDDLLRGGLGNDFVGSGFGDDTAGGGAGDDTLRGGPGHDVMTGGPGADRFIFAHAGSTDSDAITDFVAADGDVIELASSAFPALTAGGTLSPAQFGSLVLYDTVSGALSYDADGAGGTAPLLIATLAGAPALLADDMLVS